MMTDADKPKFVAALAELVALKPGAALTPEQFGAWWNAMLDVWSLEEFRSACRKLAQDCEFMPNPYHFNELRKKAGEQSAGEAWERVLKAIRTMYVREGASVDAKTDAVVRQMGGYAHLALMPSEDLKFRARDFQALWADMGDVEEARTALPNLTGVAKLTGPQGFGKLLGRRA